MCISRVSYIPNALSSGDEGPLKKKDILKNTGNLLRIRQHIYLQEENLIDPPEMFWANASLESKPCGGCTRSTGCWKTEIPFPSPLSTVWFHQMSRALDVDLRMRNLKTKVDYSLELQNTLLDLNSTVRTSTSACLYQHKLTSFLSVLRKYHTDSNGSSLSSLQLSASHFILPDIYIACEKDADDYIQNCYGTYARRPPRFQST
jgi:hypothetical protein